MFKKSFEVLTFLYVTQNTAFFYKKIPQIHIICRQFLQNIAKVTHSFQSLVYMSRSLVENPEGSYRKRLAQSFCYEQNSTISISSSSAVPKAQSWRCPALVIPPWESCLLYEAI